MYTPQLLTGLLAVTGGNWSQRGCCTKNTSVIALVSNRLPWLLIVLLEDTDLSANQPKSADETEECNRVQRKSKGTTFV